MPLATVVNIYFLVSFDTKNTVFEQYGMKNRWVNQVKYVHHVIFSTLASKILGVNVPKPQCCTLYILKTKLRGDNR